MNIYRKRFEIWTIISVGLFFVFLIFFIYPIGMLLRQAFTTPQKLYTFDNFIKFFSKPFYYNTILNSFKVSVAAAFVSLVVGIVFAYFYSFYRLKGARFLAVASVLCCMSAPFIGAYAWILLMGRSGAITLLLKNIGINTGTIYGFGGILLVQATKLYPLVFIYMNGMFGSIDNSLMEASSNLGCTGVKRFFLIVLSLSMPTILAAALLVFMRAFADFGTPLLIGEGYRTFTVEIYKQFLSETGADYGFASAISVIAIVLTAVIFWLQKYAAKKYVGQVMFVETNPCTEFWFLLHFLPNVVCRRYESYEQLLPELQKYMPGYEKTKRYFIRTNLYKYLIENGNLERAISNSEKLCQLCQESPEDLKAYSEIHKAIELLNMLIKR